MTNLAVQMQIENVCNRGSHPRHDSRKSLPFIQRIKKKYAEDCDSPPSSQTHIHVGACNINAELRMLMSHAKWSMNSFCVTAYFIFIYLFTRTRTRKIAFIIFLCLDNHSCGDFCAHSRFHRTKKSTASPRERVKNEGMHFHDGNESLLRRSLHSALIENSTETTVAISMIYARAQLHPQLQLVRATKHGKHRNNSKRQNTQIILRHLNVRFRMYAQRT